MPCAPTWAASNESPGSIAESRSSHEQAPQKLFLLDLPARQHSLRRDGHAHSPLHLRDAAVLGFWRQALARARPVASHSGRQRWLLFFACFFLCFCCFCSALCFCLFVVL